MGCRTLPGEQVELGLADIEIEPVIRNRRDRVKDL